MSMQFRPGFLGRLFSGDWLALLENDVITVKKGNKPYKQPLIFIRKVTIRNGLIWSSVDIAANNESISVGGLYRGNATHFRHVLETSVSNSIAHWIESKSSTLKLAMADLTEFYARQRYLSHRDALVWTASLNNKLPELNAILEGHAHPLYDRALIDAEMQASLVRLSDLLLGPRNELKRRNEDFVIQQMTSLRSFFQSVEGQPLTEEQQRASIVFEDCNLLVAAAGSGKSSTIVAKIGYALRTGLYRPDEILAIAFNRKAAEELDERIPARLAQHVVDSHGVTSRTFHKLGLEIITKVEGKRPLLAPWANESREQENKVIQEIIAELAASDSQFLENWMLFQAVYSQPYTDIFRFKTLEEYEAYLLQVSRERNGRRGIFTINGESVKSMEEVAIANWLYINSVSYEYERVYEFPTVDQEHRQYQPDFYYPGLNLYHEHFALDENGKPPHFFKGYEDGVRWKRALHAERQTALIETTSALYRKGMLFDCLKAELGKRGQQFQLRSREEIEARLKEYKLASSTHILIRSFLTHCKSRGQNPASLVSKIAAHRDPPRAACFLGLMESIYKAYQDKLAADKCIDFEDMIHVAARYVREGRYIHSYRLILVDEFQDISLGRAGLVKALLDHNPDCQLFSVGDDWQSIYRFAGSDISIMTHFENHFGVTAKNFLTNTFRSTQGIVDVASSFVQANPVQLKKSVKALNEATEATVQVLEYVEDKEAEFLIEDELWALSKIAVAEKKILRVYLLGRYKHLCPEVYRDWTAQFSETLKIEYSTVHSAKGMEADYVFLLAVNGGSFSFPSTITDDPLLDLVLPDAEPFEFAEERRLFYVGLTRAKFCTYVLSKKACPSPFVKELFTCSKNGTVIKKGMCPRCGTGMMRLKTGRNGRFIGCSNFGSLGCKETWALA
ncbi:MAG TPA: hypothetical protein DCZ95_14940 [Verrucomicrobia bacterium]|nr:MAG: hypothetical protein A2X46_15590 [Lentisphaerae bacterium GWF2_57_35]HBA85381.1 hypothetical protein [Verrucomicrobiota bacterium]